MKNKHLWLWGIFSIALFLRFFRLQHFGFCVDEAYSIYVANLSFKEVGIFLFNYDNHPPLFYYTLWAWLRTLAFFKLPANEFFVRLPFGIFSACQVIVLYYLTKEMSNETIAKIAAFCLAISSSMIILGGAESKMYSLLGLLILLSIYCLYKYLDTQRKLFAGGYIIFTILALYTHYLAFFVLLAVEIFMLFFLKKIGFKKWFIINVLILCGYIPWLPTVSHHFSFHPHMIKAGTNAIGYPRIIMDVFLTYFHGVPIYLKPWGLCYSALFCLIIFSVILSLLEKNNKYYPARLLALITILPVGIMTVAFCIPPYTFFSPRHTIFILPFFIILWLKKYPHIVVKCLLVIFIIFNLISLGRWYYNPSYQKAHWPEVCELLKAKNSDYDAIILQDPYQNYAFLYYYHDKYPVFYFKAGTPSTELNQFLKQYRRVCFISCYSWMADPKLKILKWLENNYYPVNAVTYKNLLDPTGDTTVIIFQRQI